MRGERTTGPERRPGLLSTSTSGPSKTRVNDAVGNATVAADVMKDGLITVDSSVGDAGRCRTPSQAWG